MVSLKQFIYESRLKFRCPTDVGPDDTDEFGKILRKYKGLSMGYTGGTIFVMSNDRSQIEQIKKEASKWKFGKIAEDK